MRTSVLLLTFLFVGSGCYHAEVITGKPAGTRVVEESFALGFIYGLIPPPELEVAADCPDGVAVVETEMSFVNGLVNFLTGGLVNPWTIRVTCAAPGSASADTAPGDIAVRSGAETTDVQAAFAEAAETAVESGEPVYVRFE
ncbi:MAG: hypothetical protein AAGI52_16770 [Bacteroidota bacterium]